MLPVNNNSALPCTSISSNCVIWQGPDIPCINICTGDSISQVVAKLAEIICELQAQVVSSEPDLSGLDLLCVLPQGQTVPDTIAEVMQLIIDYVCSIQTGMTGLPTMNLPVCLRYDDPSTGQLVSTAPLDVFATLIATKLCEVVSAVEIINITLQDHNNRLVILENCVLPCSVESGSEVQVIPSCVLPSDSAINLSTLVLEIESRFCNLENAVGPPALIAVAAGNMSCITGNTPRLSSAGAYGTLPGWMSNPSALAQYVNNMYQVICDMHTAIQNIQQNCCPSGCDAINFDFTTEIINNASGVPLDIRLNFTNSNIPSGYTDCSGNTAITITDSLGVSTITNVNVTSLQNNSSGVLVSLGSLNVYDDLSITANFCATDGTNTCTEKVSKVAPLSPICPTTAVTPTPEATGATISFPNVMGTTVVYTIRLYSAANVLLETRTVTNPSTSISEVFNNLTRDTDYKFVIEISINGSSGTCPDVLFNTGLPTVACVNGIDMAILLDYSSKPTNDMTSLVDSLKAGISNTVSSLATPSINLSTSLVLFDEVEPGSTVNYSTSTPYTSLPAGQKYTESGSQSDIYLTSLLKFGVNNGTDLITKVGLLNSSAPAGIPMGDGLSVADPVDRALTKVLDVVSPFAGAFRSNVARFIVIISDSAPSGLDDNYGPGDVSVITNLTNQCISQGIKVIVLGPSAANSAMQDLARNTGGSFNETFAEDSIETEINNICNS